VQRLRGQQLRRSKSSLWKWEAKTLTSFLADCDFEQAITGPYGPRFQIKDKSACVDRESMSKEAIYEKFKQA